MPSAIERENWRFLPDDVTAEGHFESACIVRKNADDELWTVAKVMPGPKSEDYGRIMAAAPDLLSALEEVKRMILPGQLPYETIGKMNAALAKARGL